MKAWAARWGILLLSVSQALPLSSFGMEGTWREIPPLLPREAASSASGAVRRMQRVPLPGISAATWDALRAGGSFRHILHPLREGSLRGGGPDKSRYYKILGIDQGCDDQDVIKKAYKKMALKWHPDRHQGDKTTAEKKFKELSEAYQVLSDKDKKTFYDQHGEEELKASMNGSPDGKPQQQPSGFSSHGDGGGFGPNVRFSTGTGGHHFDTSDFGFEDGGGRGGFGDPFKIFEDFFGGGMGGAGSSKRSGRESPARREIPTQKPLPCTLEELYSGSTRKYRVGDHPREEIVTIDVKPGWKAGTKITFDDIKPPVIFVVEEKKHRWFVRDGDDLTTTISVSRAQADKGIKVTIPLLDGTDHIVHTGARQIFHGYCSVARGKGMPIKGGPKRGDLKIEFRVAKP